MLEPWSELRTAMVLAQQGTVSDAASVLGVHRATVMRHIDILEDYLGTRLFLRHAKGYALTETGQEMLESSARMDRQFTDFAGRVRGQSELVTGELVITAVSAISAMLMPSIARYRARFPTSAVHYKASPELAELGYGEAHIAIRGGPKPDNPNYVVIAFQTIRMGLYCSGDFAARANKTIALGQWHDLPFVMPKNHPPNSFVIQWLHDHVPAHNQALVANDHQTTIQGVLAGVGAGWIAEHDAQQWPDLVELIPPQPGFKNPLWFVTHVDMHRTAKVQAFKNILVNSD